MDRPITTLFMLMSLDGKISPGASDDLELGVLKLIDYTILNNSYVRVCYQVIR